jgi:GntR family transcriptional regulator, arabinose operon transcriptional repressor
MAAETRQPIYRRVLKKLAAEISGGRFKPGQKFPSEAALVRRFGASRITVGRAVHELQQLGLVDRVAGSGTYVRGVEGRAGESPLFGLIIPDLGETEIFEPICQGIANAPEAAGCGLLWPHAEAERGSSISSARDGQALQLCEQCIARRVAGVFFAPLEMTPAALRTNQRVLRLLEEAGIPVVLLDRRPAETSTRRRHDLVGIDNRRAGFIAAEHLLRLGSQRIGFLMYEGQAPTARARAAGYREAAGNGLVFELKPIGSKAEEPLALPPEAKQCDGFVCANDRIAGRLMHTLLAEKVRIPGDVRIVGIDDVNYASLLPVPLTTIHQPCHEIGEAALRVLIERLKRPKSPARDTLLDCELVVRESCGALSQQ